MSHILIPEQQELYPTPNRHVNFEFDNSIEEYRTSRYLNQILKVIGNDRILWGLDIKEEVRTEDSLTITVNLGSLIQDSTLIKSTQEVDMYLLNLSSACMANETYYPIIYTTYQFSPVTVIPTAQPNPFNMSMGILDTTSNIIYNGDPSSASQVVWDTNKNRIVIYAAPITNPDYMVLTVNIEGDIYTIGSSKNDPNDFDYNTIECFEVDGGIIN